MNTLPSKKTALVLTVSPWDEPKRLRKQLAEVLALDMHVVYVTLPYGFRKPAGNIDRMDGSIRVLSLASLPVPMRLLAKSAALQWAYEHVLSWRLGRALRSSGPVDTVFTFTQMHPGILDRFARERVIYVANDDHASMALDAGAAAGIARDEQRAVTASARVLSVSEVIARKLSRFGKPVHVMYPGHDSTALPLARFGADLPARRSACFFGYIDWRVDFELLAFMLEHDWTIGLIGQEVGTASQIAALKARFGERFQVYPPVPAAQAPALLACYHVLMMPYRYRNAGQAEVMELPNKTFVYFCALRPVVATFMPNLKLVEPGLIYRADGNAQFLACCEQALADDGPAHAARRAQLAAENSWAARRATLRSLIDGSAAALEGRAP